MQVNEARGWRKDLVQRKEARGDNGGGEPEDPRRGGGGASCRVGVDNQLPDQVRREVGAVEHHLVGDRARARRQEGGGQKGISSGQERKGR